MNVTMLTMQFNNVGRCYYPVNFPSGSAHCSQIVVEFPVSRNLNIYKVKEK